MIELKKPGKLVIRQSNGAGEMPRLPIKRHTDTKTFLLRINVVAEEVTIQIFTSTEPKEIKYVNI